MWHQWLYRNFAKLREYFLCAKKTKITSFNNSSPPHPNERRHCAAVLILTGIFDLVLTKNDNYKDNDISVHTSKLYRLFILSKRVSAALNSSAHYSRIMLDGC